MWQRLARTALLTTALLMLGYSSTAMAQRDEQAAREQLDALGQEIDAMAERLSAIHGINAPEFYDKKVMTTFIASLKAQELLQVNDDGQQIAAPAIGELSDAIDELIDPPVLQTIRQSVQQLLVETGKTDNTK